MRSTVSTSFANDDIEIEVESAFGDSRLETNDSARGGYGGIWLCDLRWLILKIIYTFLLLRLWIFFLVQQFLEELQGCVLLHTWLISCQTLSSSHLHHSHLPCFFGLTPKLLLHLPRKECFKLDLQDPHFLNQFSHHQSHLLNPSFPFSTKAVVCSSSIFTAQALRTAQPYPRELQHSYLSSSITLNVPAQTSKNTQSHSP